MRHLARFFPVGLALLGLGFWIAASFIDAPFLYNVDEVQVASRAFGVVVRRDLDPNFLIYPHGLLYLQALVTAAVDAIFGLNPGAALDPYRPPPIETWPNYFALRMISASAAAGAVYLISDLGRRCFGSVVGVAAGLILIGSNLLRHSASHATVDATLCFLITLGVYFLARALEEGRPRLLWAAAMAFGAAASVKYNGAVFLVYLPFVSYILSKDPRAVAKQTIGGGLLAFSVFACLSPFVLVHGRAFFDPNEAGLMYDLVHYQTGHEGFDEGSTVSRALLEIHNGISRASALVVFAPWAISASKTKRRVLGLLLAQVALVFLVISQFRVLFPRNLLPLAPALALLVPASLKELGAVWGARRPALTLAPLALTLLPLVLSWAHDYKTVRAVLEELVLPDTRSAALQWMEVNVPKSARILHDQYGPHTELFGWPTRIEHKLSALRWEQLTEGTDYIITSSPQWSRFLRSGTGSYERLESAPVLQHFDPSPKTSRGPSLRIYSVPALPGG
ncbi:MAG: glycosyltransferase family 39 protein [Myxococcota bacterium]